MEKHAERSEVGCQVSEFDLTPELFFTSAHAVHELSSINESENDESTNNLLILSSMVKNLNKEIADQERTIELQHHQIQILKETIKDLERKHSFDRAYEDRVGPYSDHLKTSVCRLVSQMPKLSAEGEGLVSLILSLLLLGPDEVADLQYMRTSKTAKKLMCFLGE
jgi:hypothetical protein